MDNSLSEGIQTTQRVLDKNMCITSTYQKFSKLETQGAGTQEYAF